MGNGEYRKITKIVENRIYMRTGVTTKAEKYTTKEMIQYAYEIISEGKEFTSKDLKSRFPEYNQGSGSCVFSMTGGILELVGFAERRKRSDGKGVAYISVRVK